MDALIHRQDAPYPALQLNIVSEVPAIFIKKRLHEIEEVKYIGFIA